MTPLSVSSPVKIVAANNALRFLLFTQYLLFHFIIIYYCKSLLSRFWLGFVRHKAEYRQKIIIITNDKCVYGKSVDRITPTAKLKSSHDEMMARQTDIYQLKEKGKEKEDREKKSVHQHSERLSGEKRDQAIMRCACVHTSWLWCVCEMKKKEKKTTTTERV